MPRIVHYENIFGAKVNTNKTESSLQMNNKDKHDSALSPRTRKYFHSKFFYRGQICRFEGLSIMSTDEISNIVALELLSPHLSLVSSSNVIIKFYYQIEKKQRVR